jgi:hypothetical protein
MGGIMSGAVEQLRNSHPGEWLLIRLDGPEAETGILLAASKDPEHIDRELEKRARLEGTRLRPLYVTYSIPESGELPYFAY